MPQDVALSAAGAQIVPPAQTDGRMPESGAVADDAVQQSSPVGAIAATMVSSNNASSQTDGSLVQQTGAGETTSGMVAIGDITGKASSQQSPGLAPLEQGMMQTAQQAVAVKFEGTSPIPTTHIGTMESKSPVHVIPVPPETTVPVSQTGVVASDTAAAAQTPGGETGAKTETLPSGSTNPGAKDTSTAPAKGQITAGNAAVIPTVSETSSNKLNVADSSKEVAKVVSGFSTAVNSSAGNQQRADHTPEKPAVMAENDLKSSAVSQLVTVKDDLADGSDPGSSGKKFDDFMPKSAETPTNVTQQVAGGHQLFSAETLTSAPPQPSQAEAVHPDSHEQVARQVQEQLTGYSLKQGNDQITLKLSPDHLGDIKINLSLEDQHLKVQIVTETTTARDSLLQHVDSLKESLARQNISIDKFDVTTGGGGTGSQSNNNAQGAWSELAKNRQSQQWLSTGGYRTSPVATVPLAPMYLAQTEHAMVDVHF
ncbi:MAG: flagellar hook-length control protein FliK [Geobacteraceae bacterium]|nr:flagellar hook-length control protein FliK [Geobacteraceae bacterium]